MKTYETVIVIDSLIKSEEIDEIISKYERVISNNGGKIITIERWGKKRLMYEIKKRQYGYYTEIIFEAPPNLINVLEREYRLEENILRYLTVHLNKRALEYREQRKLKDTEPEQNVEPVATEIVESKKDVVEETEEHESASVEEDDVSVVEPSSDNNNKDQ